jgi:hypothetical protein
MIKLDRQHIDAIRLSNELSSVVAGYLDEPTLVSRTAKDLSDADYDSLHDACYDALTNDAPTVKQITGEGDFGPFHIIVRGVPNAYFVSALDFDNKGLFTSSEEAEAWADFNYEPFTTRAKAHKQMPNQVRKKGSGQPS